jgi:phage protein D
MNRAERRAAAQAAAELEEARQAFLRSKAEAEAMRYQEETGDLGTGLWVDDEVDVDAI